MRKIGFIALGLLVTCGLFGQTTINGELTDDANLNSKGNPAVEYTIKIKEKRMLEVWLNSDDFDPVLIIESEDGTVFEDDDTYGNNSYLSLIVDPGEYKIWAGTYGSDEYDESSGLGQFELVYEKGPVAKVTTIEGRLNSGDSQLPKGEYFDRIDQNINPNGHFIIRLQAYGFTGFLCVESPSGKVYRSSDFESNGGFNYVKNLAPEKGIWKITVTSSYTDSEGGYDVEIIDLGADPKTTNTHKPIELE